MGSKPESIDRAKNMNVCGCVKLGSYQAYQTMINKYRLKVCSSVVHYKLQLIPSTGLMLRDNLNEKHIHVHTWVLVPKSESENRTQIVCEWMCIVLRINVLLFWPHIYKATFLFLTIFLLKHLFIIIKIICYNLIYINLLLF